MRSRRKRGFSLLEALFASFLLLTSVLLSVQLFDSSLKAEADNEQRSIAAVVAENGLEEMRASAREDFSSLKSLYDGKSWRDSDNPNFTLTANVSEQILAAPCTELESQYPNPGAAFPNPRPREMGNSVWKIQLEVDWPRAGSSKVTVVEYLASLKKVADFSIAVSPTGPDKINEETTGTFTVPRSGTLDFTAQAFADREEIKDIQFSWYVEPLNGFGSVHRESRDGTQCRYLNGYRTFNLFGVLYKFSPGKCDLVVKAEYQGKVAVRKVRIENL